MDNPLKKILSKISSMGAASGDSAVGIDIGSSAIKVVEIKKKGGRAVLETYGSIALGPYGDVDAGKVTNLPIEKIVEALKQVLKQSEIEESDAALAVPVQSSLIFNLELPANLDSREMASIVPTEARKYIPVPITEVSIDYSVLPKRELSFQEMNTAKSQIPQKEIEKTNVLVVATQNDAIAKCRSILSQSGLSAAFFEIEVFSSLRANFEHELSPVLLVDFGASRTKLSVVEFGMVKNYHTIDRGGADISQSISVSLSIPFSEAEKMKKEFGLFGNPAEKSLADIVKVHTDYIFAEANNFVLSYEKRYNRTINKVILTGGASLLKGLRENAETNFKVEVTTGHPFGKVAAPAFLEKVLETMGPEFAVSIGLALRKLQ